MHENEHATDSRQKVRDTRNRLTLKDGVAISSNFQIRLYKTRTGAKESCPRASEEECNMRDYSAHTGRTPFCYAKIFPHEQKRDEHEEYRTDELVEDLRIHRYHSHRTKNRCRYSNEGEH